MIQATFFLQKEGIPRQCAVKLVSSPLFTYDDNGLVFPRDTFHQISGILEATGNFADQTNMTMQFPVSSLCRPNAMFGIIVLLQDPVLAFGMNYRLVVGSNALMKTPSMLEALGLKANRCNGLKPFNEKQSQRKALILCIEH